MSGQIVFLQEPANVTVAEGTTAFFACTYNGTTAAPEWKINDRPYLLCSLPSRHSYDGSGLVVENVNLSMNMNSYSCFFELLPCDGTVSLKEIESNTGFLFITGLNMPLSTNVSLVFSDCV